MDIAVICCPHNVDCPDFYSEAHTLGQLLGKYQHNLIFGGMKTGIMGTLASVASRESCKITGVIEENNLKKGVAFAHSDRLIAARDSRDRKTTVNNLTQAYIALPGGSGTLEEVMEIITLKQLRIHNKPVILINTNGFFDSLNVFFKHLNANRSWTGKTSKSFHFAGDSNQALDQLDEIKAGATHSYSYF